VKGGEEGERVKERALECDDATAADIVVNPQHRHFGRRESDFALQGLIECSAAKTELVRVALLWHSCGSEVSLGLPLGL
jgi:hypothetical protein